MGTSTSTIFGPNGPQTTTLGGTVRPTTVRPITVRALDTQTRRLERSVEQRQQQQQQARTTAFYRGARQFSTLGAAGGYRPRGSVTSGGVPIGQAVPANNGLVGGMPAGSLERVALTQSPEQITRIAQERGPQIGTGDPNTNGNTPRYSQDLYYDQVTGVLWIWEPTEEAWVIQSAPSEALDFRIEVPEATTYTLSAYQHYAVRVDALEGVSGATVTVSPAIGATAAVGTAISITVSGLPDPVVPVVGSILLRRV